MRLTFILALITILVGGGAGFRPAMEHDAMAAEGHAVSTCSEGACLPNTAPSKTPACADVCLFSQWTDQGAANLLLPTGFVLLALLTIFALGWQHSFSKIPLRAAITPYLDPRRLLTVMKRE